jgi:FkbM family methyltransferase
VHTYSFEPIPEHLDMLRRSIELNGLQDRVTVHPFALSSRNGTETIHASGSGSSLVKEFTDADARPEQIETRTLDSLDLPGADFVKIDIEGHELEALRGAAEKLKRYRPFLFVEIAYTLRNLGRDFTNRHFAETFELLASMGYRAEILEGDTLRAFDHTSETPDGVHMYLFTIDNAIA